MAALTTCKIWSQAAKAPLPLTDQEVTKVTIACTVPGRNKAVAAFAGSHKFVLDNSHMESWAKGRAEGVAAGYESGRAEGQWDGMIQGRLEGLTEGYANALVFILERRFGSLPDNTIDRICEASVDELCTWLEVVCDVRTPEDMLACQPE